MAEFHKKGNKLILMSKIGDECPRYDDEYPNLRNDYCRYKIDKIK